MGKAAFGTWGSTPNAVKERQRDLCPTPGTQPDTEGRRDTSSPAKETGVQQVAKTPLGR